LFEPKETIMKKFALKLCLSLSTLGNVAWAHEGHGLGGTHWHATDALGFVVAAALVALAVYFGKK
jgi:hypothetical protein